MMKIRLRGILFGVIILLLLASSSALAQTETQEESKLAGDVTALAAPPMSKFINIRFDYIENRRPQVAFNSRHGEFLVVWEEEIHGGEVAIYGRRVGLDGETKGDAFAIQHFANRQLGLPEVAYSVKQDKYLVVFTEKVSSTNYDIAVVPVSWNGVVGSGYFIDWDSEWDWYPTVAYNVQNDEYLVVWENCISCQGGTRRDIKAQRIDASTGALLSWRYVAGSDNVIRRLPAVAYNFSRNEYLIAYTRHSNLSTVGDIVGLRTNFNMSWPVLSEIQITLSGYPPQVDVAIAAGPDEYMVVWDEDYGATKNSIWGRRVGGDGSLHSFIPLANDTGKIRFEPEVSFGDGGHYLVTWRYVGGTWDIFGRHVRAGQNSPEGPEFPIDDGAGHQKVPAVSCAGSSPCLVVYEDEYPGPDYEIRGRLVGHRRIHLPITLR
jgi:hypothetical protein